jgi:hypothetical protein
MDATHSHPVRVPAAVLEGLDAVLLSGETDMIDKREVQAQAHIMGYPETMHWIGAFPILYHAGLNYGFVAEALSLSE